MSGTLDLIRSLVAHGEYLVSSQGYEQIDEDGMVADDLIDSVSTAEVIEDYPDAVRGPSVLLLHVLPDGEIIHAVWGIPRGQRTPAVLITTYRPDPTRWSADFRTRRRPR